MQTAYSAYRERRLHHHNHQKYSIVSVLQWNTSLLWPIPWHNTFIAAHLTDASF